MGAPSVGNRVDSSDLDLARAETPDPLSATGAPLATTNIQPGRSRRSLLLLGALFFGVLVVAFVAARSFLHAGPEVAPAASGATAASAAHTASDGTAPGNAKSTPEVLPVSGQVPPAPSASAETNELEPPAKATKESARQRPRAAKNPPPPSKPVDTSPPKPGRPKDELGY